MIHMDIDYFYMTEHVQNRTFSIEHCPTKDMLADFTMPFQGGLFMKLCNFIMGAKYADGDQHAQRSVLSEDANKEGNKLGAVEPAGADWRKQEKDPVGKENKE